MKRCKTSVSCSLALTFLLAPFLQGCGDSTSNVTADPAKLKAALAKRKADAGEPARPKPGTRKAD